MSNTDTYTVFCFLPGNSDVFQVDYNRRTTFGHLKEAIKQEKINTLGLIDAHLLKLYKINVDFDGIDHYRTIIDKMSKGCFQFDLKEELAPGSLLVSDNFQEQSNMIQILVEPPEGESIYCGGVPVVTPSFG